MKIAVIGLGTEGKMAVQSLLDHGHEVYASDLNKNLEIKARNNLKIELGKHDWEEIENSDAIVISPSLWDLDIIQKIDPSKLLGNILTQHKDLFTIGVTGTNGKTTTCHLIKQILEEAGSKVLLGGNAGGGFQGYTELILEASEQSYDFLVVEICDMTLNFCRDSFEFDLIVVTNLGHDHLDVHLSLQKYQESLQNFLTNKIAILNKNDPNSLCLGKNARKTIFFDFYTYPINLYGKYNLQNAAAAAAVGEYLGIPIETIKIALERFEGVEGRTTSIDFPNKHVVIGKTDNADAARAIFQEETFDLMILGTPRIGEDWRYDILKEVARENPSMVILFPGLEDTTALGEEELIKNGYQGSILIMKTMAEVVDFVKQTNYPNIFIGGNGQEKIIGIKRKLINILSNFE